MSKKVLVWLPVILSLSFICGIAIGSFIVIPNQLALLGIIVAVFLGLLILMPSSKRYQNFLIQGSFFILGLCLGILLINQKIYYLRKLKTSNHQNIISKEAIIKARVVSEKEIREKYARYTIQRLNSSSGKILLLTAQNNNYQYGDILKLNGKLELPQSQSNFDYQGYLAKDGIYWLMPFPRIQLLHSADSSFGNLFYQNLYRLRSRIRHNIIKGFSGKDADFLRAIILGDKGVIGSEFRQQLSRAGVSHIVAISGLHLSILAIFLFDFLLFLGFWRKQATILTIIFMGFLLVFVGFRASLVRAVLMASIALVSFAAGKLFQGERALLYTAVLMLAFNPLLLRYDVGFQLSFLAVFGILTLYPAFSWLFAKMKMPQIVSDVFSVTLSAQLFTLPIIITNFQIISLVAPLSNFLVLSFLPFILGAAFLWAVVTLIHSVSFLSFVLFPLIESLINFIQWISHFSFSALNLQNQSAIFYFNVIYYFFLIIFVIIWKRFYKKHLTPLAQYSKWKEK